MRVLGIDPGTAILGFGVIEKQLSSLSVLSFGCLRLSARLSFSAKLKAIFEKIEDVVSEFQPDSVAIESLFYAKNPKVAIKMAHARGVILFAAENQGLPIAEYSPREVKQSVTGNGGASKEQVQRMLQQILVMKEIPTPLDASDALAVAMCHLHRAKVSI